MSRETNSTAGVREIQSIFEPGFDNMCMLFKTLLGTSLVVQGIRICPPGQETLVQSLIREDPTRLGATKLMHHNYWSCTLEPRVASTEPHAFQSLCSVTREATAMRSPHTTARLYSTVTTSGESPRAAGKTQQVKKQSRKRICGAH